MNYRFVVRQAYIFTYIQPPEDNAPDYAYAMYDVRKWMEERFGPPYESEDGLTWTCKIWEEKDNKLFIYDEDAATEFKLRWV